MKISGYYSIPVLLVVLLLSGCASSGSSTVSGTSAARKPTSVFETSGRGKRFFLNGSTLQMRGRYREALEQFRYALLYDSLNGATHYAISKCFRALHIADSAEEYALQAVQLDPGNLIAREYIIDLYTESYRYDSVIAHCEALIQLQPRNINAHYTIAQILRKRDPNRARTHFEYILENYGEDPNVLLNLAEIYFDAKQYDSAAMMMADLAVIRPDEPTIYRLLTEAYWRAGDSDNVRVTFAQADLHLGKKEFDEYYIGQSDALIEEMHKTKSPALATRMVAVMMAHHDRKNQSWDARINKGKLLYALDKEDGLSDTVMMIALKDNAATLSSWVSIATLYATDRKFARLLNVCGSTARRFKRDDRAMLIIGIAHAELYNNDSAIKYLRMATDLNESNTDAWERLAFVYNRVAQYGASDSAYERALLFDPQNALIMNNYAYCLACRSEKLGRAQELAKRAVELNPSSPSFQDTYGWVCYRLKDYHKAERALRQAIELGGSNAEVLEHLGDVLHDMGNVDDAFEYYQQAYKLNPKSSVLRQKASGK